MTRRPRQLNADVLEAQSACSVVVHATRLLHPREGHSTSRKTKSEVDEIHFWMTLTVPQQPIPRREGDTGCVRSHVPVVVFHAMPCDPFSPEIFLVRVKQAPLTCDHVQQLVQHNLPTGQEVLLLLPLWLNHLVLLLLVRQREVAAEVARHHHAEAHAEHKGARVECKHG